ncbi:CAP domain-containing protein [Ornithinibacillus halophilus]|uniref:Uncharacterized protein, YkwD family n=1 Tax=Ornithinibacillus halophilus TaxID=930117 RepID=A0A1M5L4X5_9BACI|nr:CAP domain-containing protein [Ornithinibacillus halophilus]SHG60041.1 uncharacterized protein, YkwD family [Ornithinibacillus halophilus]
MQTKKLFIPLLLALFTILVACADNDNANEGTQRNENLNISSISTDSPNQDYSQTQDKQGQGYGNNFRPIGTHSEAPNQKMVPDQPHPQQGQQQGQQPNQQADRNAATHHDLSEFESEVVALTNRERENAGLSILEVDNSLSNVAREKSQDMQANSYFSHTSPTYGSPFDMMGQFGITYRSAAENIARGQASPQEVVEAWMNSEGHRANILNGGFTHIGVGFEENGNYWTQMFIRK